MNGSLPGLTWLENPDLVRLPVGLDSLDELGILGQDAPHLTPAAGDGRLPEFLADQEIPAEAEDVDMAHVV